VLEFNLVTNAGNSNREQEIQIIADTMREYGVKVETQALEFSLLVDQLLATGDERPFDAILIGFGASTEDWPFFEGIFSCTGTFHMWNQAGDCLTPQELLVSELVRRGRGTIDDEAAREVGYQIMDNFADLQPIIYTTSVGIHASWLNSIGGELPDSLFSPFNGIRDLVTTYRK
jgi:peptide/nickel transport system substrate-binding protein